jgi:hypothetical protein
MATPKLEASTLIGKGVFAVGVVAIAGIVGAVHFVNADPTSNTSGYGTSSAQDVAAANTFEAALVDQTNTFTGDIAGLQTQAESQLQSDSGTADFTSFDSQYDTATSTYASQVSTAFDTFRSQVMSYANTATSKDQFIDEFNNAKATYLNALDAAKNQLAASLSNLSGNGNVVKDQFIDGFNSDRDAYSNDLEQAKNDFAATLG